MVGLPKSKAQSSGRAVTRATLSEPNEDNASPAKAGKPLSRVYLGLKGSGLSDLGVSTYEVLEAKVGPDRAKGRRSGPLDSKPEYCGPGKVTTKYKPD